MGCGEVRAYPSLSMSHTPSSSRPFGEISPWLRRYDKSEEKFVSESFIVKLNKFGQPHDASTLGDLRCAFTEIVINNPCQLCVAVTYRNIGVKMGVIYMFRKTLLSPIHCYNA